MTNRPRYAPLAPDPCARAHLLVVDHQDIAGAVFAPGHTVSDFPERWDIVAHARVLPEPFGGPGVQHFR